MKNICYVLIFSSLFLCCKKEFPPEFDLGSLYPELIGEWTWNRTIYINGPFPEIPETTDPSLSYSLNIRSNGAVEYYQDGFLIHARFIKNFDFEFEHVENGRIINSLVFKLHTYLNDELYLEGDGMIFNTYNNIPGQIGVLGYPFSYFDHPIFGEIPTRNLYVRE